MKDCKYLKQSPVAPYEEWCELHKNAQFPPCSSCKENKEKKYNSTTDKWE